MSNIAQTADFGSLRVFGNQVEVERERDWGAFPFGITALVPTATFSNCDTTNIFNRAGFAPRITAEGLKVISVFQDSPASKAGIAPGDLILKINGRPGQNLDVPFLYQLLRQPPGTLLHIQLRHQGVKAPNFISPITL